jgi:hypothetical protein
MSQFEDRHGRAWKVTLTVADLKPLREELKFDLADLSNGRRLFEVMYGEPEKLVAALHLLAKPTDVTPEDFAGGFDGPTLERGGTALLEAVADFFPRSRIAQALKATIREAMSQADEAVMTFLESSGGATNSPACAGSTPAP